MADPNRQHRDDVDAEVMGLIRRGIDKAEHIERELKSSNAAKALSSGLRPLSRVVDQSLQRLRRAGEIRFVVSGGFWVVEP